LFEEIKETMSFKYIGRVASASPATGSYAIHGLEQEKLVSEALSDEEADEISRANEPAVSEQLSPASS